MKVFISYAGEDRATAEKVHYALTNAGHDTFFDKRNLPPGADFHKRIQGAVEASDIFVFLISKFSVEPGSYTLTELKYAEDKWPRAADGLLPVLLSSVDFASIPAYAQSVTVYDPRGSVAGEVLHEIEKRVKQDQELKQTKLRQLAIEEAARKKQRRLRLAAIAVFAALAIEGFFWFNPFNHNNNGVGTSPRSQQRDTATAQQPPQLREEEISPLRRNDSTAYWVNGSTILVRFLDGTKAQQHQVWQAIRKWFPYVNLTFLDVTDNPAVPSHIRISLKPKGSWSYVGTNSLNIPPREPTINYQWLDEQYLLHEFGHALGLIHEFQSPNAHIPWNKPAVYDHFREQGLTRQRIDYEILDIVSPKKIGSYRPFDPNSIMNYKFEPSLTANHWVAEINGLTASDKALVSRIYPR